MRPLLLIAPALVLATFAPVRTSAGSSEIVFTKVLDSDALAPGGLGPFGSFEIGQDGRQRLAMDYNGNLAFFAGSRAFAIIGGEMHLVSEPRGYPAQIEIEEARVTFAHYGESGTEGGIFRWQRDGDVIEVAGARTFVPGGGACVFWTQEDHGVAGHPFRVDGNAVLFSGTSNDRSYDDGQHFDCDDLAGSFLWRDGSIERIAYRGSGASIDAGFLVYMDRDGALYARSAGEAPQRIVGIGDPLPAGSGFIRTIGSFSLAASRIAFREGTEPTRSSVFLWDGGSLSLVANAGMPVPGGRKLERIESLRLADDRIAIFGSDGQGPFIYLASLNRGWERVVDLSGPDRFYSAGGIGEFIHDQLVVEGQRIVYGRGEDGLSIRWGRAISVLRPDASLLDVLGEGDSLEGRVAGVPFSGDLRGSKLALGISDASGEHLYVAELPPIEVDIDIKPHRARNRVRASSHQPIRVAILGNETFHVEDVDVATLGFGPGAAGPVGRARLRDVDGDGWADLVLRFRPRETGIAAGETAVCVSGESFDGVEFEGCDNIRASRGRATHPFESALRASP